jgi:hypothetical protein
MSEIYPSDAELNALLSDAETGVEYIPTGTAPYYVHFRRLLYRLLLATKRANDFRLFPEGGLSFGVKSGVFWAGKNQVIYAGSTGNVARDNRTDFVYLDKDMNVVIDSMPVEYWTPFSPMVFLAQISSVNGEITNIEDCRNRHSTMLPLTDRPEIIEKTVSGEQLNHDDSGSIITNAGATGSIVVYLPTFDYPGTRYTFCVQENQMLVIDPLTLNIRCWSGGGTTRYTVYSSTIGDCITLVSDGNGNWMSTAMHGSWASGVS